MEGVPSRELIKVILLKKASCAAVLLSEKFGSKAIGDAIIQTLLVIADRSTIAQQNSNTFPAIL